MYNRKKMKFMELIVLNEDVNSVIEYLGRDANFQIHSNIGDYDAKSSNLYGDTLVKLQTIASFLSIKEPLKLENSTKMPSKIDEEMAKKILNKVENLKEKEIEMKERLKKITEAYEEALAFSKLKVPYKEIDNLTFLTIRIGKINPDIVEELQFSVGNRAIIIPVSSDKSRILATASKKGRFALDSELKKVGFIPMDIPKDFKGVPDDVLLSLKEKLQDAKKTIEKIDAEKKELVKAYEESILQLLQNFSLGTQVLNTKQNLEATQSTYRIPGWISGSDETKMVHNLDNLTQGRIAIRLYDPKEVPSVKTGREKIPVYYKHNKFVKSFERIIFSYGAPLYGTIDPTPIVAIFFTLLFGIMFGDLGQGAVLFLSGILMGTGKSKFSIKYNKFSFIFLAVGLSSMIMGFLTGEFFTNGELLIPVSRFITGLFGEPRNHILHLMPEGDSIKKLLMFFVFTLSVGFIINSMGLIINIINNFKLKRIASAVFSKTGIAGLFFFWFVIFVALKIGLIKMPFMWFDIVLLVLPLLCIFFSEPLERLLEKKTPVFENGFFSGIIEGLVEILEVISTYISNSVSFLRVGAFALSHAVLSFIVFTMTNILGGYLSFGILVAIIGNLIIILLEGLIVWIQVIRLQYYEFFSKFFIETGREFKPFRFKY